MGRALKIVLAVGGLGWFIVMVTPLPEQVRRAPMGTRLLAADGSLLHAPLGDDGTRGHLVPLSAISPHLIHATLAGEDHRFFAHPGLDPLAIARAVWLNVTSGRVAFGGSTITQQLARLSFPGPRTLGQKLKEAFWALVLEDELSKDEILARYLSMAPYGGNLRGVAAASEAYFRKAPSQLSLAEASLLAVIPRAPTRYDPRRGLPAARKRRDHVLELMVARGFINQGQAQTARLEPLKIHAPAPPLVAPHAVRWLLARGLEGEVRTTLDPAIQQRVEALARGIVTDLGDRGVTNAAALVIELPDGQVRAYAGSADFSDEAHDGQVDGVQARRSPGSALKPLIYATALEQGMTPATILFDVARPFPAARGVYRPHNFDRKEHGPVRLREALANSDNLAAVDLAERLGADGVLQAVRAFGIPLPGGTSDALGLGVVLGGVDVSLWELARAYLALARGGTLVEPSLVEGDRRVAVPVVSPITAHLISDILSDDVARSRTFGRHSALALPYPAAVKTGTSKDFRDNWAVGFTRHYLVATWAGDFRGRPMGGVSGISGAGTLWHRIMRSIHRNDPPGFDAPNGLRHARICAASGLQPTPRCPQVIDEKFAPGTEPVPRCTSHRAPDGGGAAVDRVVLLQPTDGAVFRLDPDRGPDGTGLQLHARGPTGVDLELSVDGVVLARGQTHVVAPWTAVAGHHEAVARAGNQHASARFTVR